MDTITPHGFSNLGGLDKPVDKRDIKLGATSPAKYTHPISLTNAKAWAMPIEYQGQQPACGAHAGAEVKDLLLGTRFSPRATWADLKSFDGWPIDAGTDIRSIFKSITKNGVIDFDVYGNDVSLSETSYARSLTDALKALALRRSGSGYGFITDLSFDGLKQFISDHGPSILLLRVGAEWWTAAGGAGSWAEKDILPLRTPNPAVSGHFVVAHSFDDQYIYFVNHWSDSWGRKGHGYFGANYMPFITDAGALFPLSFTKDLSIGMADPEVANLQKYLNAHGYIVAPAGQPGSAGHETNYFGSLTEAAVKHFQSANGISPVSGYFGPLSRAFATAHP